MSNFPLDDIKNVDDLYRETAQLVENSAKTLPLDAQSKSALLQVLGLIKVPDIEIVSQQLASFTKQAASDEQIHPLVLMALSVGQASLKTASGGAPIAGTDISTWHVDLATTPMLWRICSLVVGAGAALGASAAESSSCAVGIPAPGYKR